MKKIVIYLAVFFLPLFFLSACYIGPAPAPGPTPVGPVVTPEGCDEPSDCASDEVCVSGVCELAVSIECDEDSDCPAGSLCDESVGHCIPD